MLAVRVDAGQTLVIAYRQLLADGSAYLVSDCSDGRSCFAGADATGPGEVEHIAWTNGRPDPADLFLVLDCGAAGCGPYELDMTLE